MLSDDVFAKKAFYISAEPVHHTQTTELTPASLPRELRPLPQAPGGVTVV
jgi:hypothetical protein